MSVWNRLGASLRRSPIRRIGRNVDGIAAVEFALLVPILFIMFIGTLEIGQAVGLDRRVSMAVASTADLIGREKTMQEPQDFTGVMDVVKHLLSPYESSRLQISIVSVKADPANAANTRVEWSYSHNGASVPSRCQSYAMPAGLLAANSSAIIVEGTYDYEPLLVSHFLNASVTLRDKATVSPRNSCVQVSPHNTGCTWRC